MQKKLHRDPQAWTPERAWAWYQSHPRALGFNHVPSYAVNTTEMWQADTFNIDWIRKELLLAQDCGFNCVRVFLPYIVWQQNPYSFLQRLERYLTAASSCGLTVIPVLFDDCAFAGREPYAGWQDEPLPGVHNSGWTACPGASMVEDPGQYPELRGYVNSIVGTYREDRRILFWDVYNEPGNDNRGARSLYFLYRAFEWVRDHVPVQPISCAVWAHAEQTANGLHFVELAALELSDIVTFHQYADAAALEQLIAKLQPIGLPMICTEWFARTVGSVYPTHLPVFAAQDVGCVQWGLVNGRTQTHIPHGWDPANGEPPVWFHDIFRFDHSPYNMQEIALVREYAASCKRSQD